MFHYADNTEDDTIFYSELRSAVAHAMDGIKADAEHRFKITPVSRTICKAKANLILTVYT